MKEGSIGSLLIRMPWKGRGCVVEVEELELVLVPGRESCLPSVGETLHSGQDQGNPFDSGNLDHDPMDSASKFASGNIHEGVKTVAKMVKWFLTSFNVKLKNLIIAFNPQLEKIGDKSEFHRTLVLRVSEIECGTCVSDDANVNPEAKGENFLGISRLTNFVKFHGAALELLQLDDDDNDPDDDVVDNIQQRRKKKREKYHESVYKSRNWILKKKERERNKGRDVRPDTKYTGRRRKMKAI